MNHYIINTLFFMFSTPLIAGDLPNTFDPILGLTVSESSVVVSHDGIQRLAEEYAVVQLPVGTNVGNISAELLDEGGDIILPKDTELVISLNATGNSLTTVITDLKNTKTAMATAQINDGSTLSSIANFEINPRNNEQRIIRATGNKIVYQHQESP